jgi:hypothetical protein
MNSRGGGGGGGAAAAAAASSGQKIHHRTVLPKSQAMMQPGRFGHSLVQLMSCIVVFSMCAFAWKWCELRGERRRVMMMRRRRDGRRGGEEEEEEVGYEQFLKSESYLSSVNGVYR